MYMFWKKIEIINKKEKKYSIYIFGFYYNNCKSTSILSRVSFP